MGCLSKKLCYFLGSILSRVRLLLKGLIPVRVKPRSLFLGLYMQEVSTMYPKGSRRTVQSWTPNFVPLGYQGTELKDGTWGNFDETLSFLPMPFTIVGSSNGFLLCCVDLTTNMNYIVCNPVTREFHYIPEPRVLYPDAAVALIIHKGYDSSLSRTCYEIVRVGEKSPLSFEVEIFSSATNEWMQFSIICPTQIMLPSAIRPAFVHNNLIFWRCFGYPVMVYDQATQSVGVLQLPKRGDSVCWCDHLGESEGKILYSRSSRSDIEVWELKDVKKSDWIVKHQANSYELLKQNPHVLAWDTIIGLEQFHPHDSRLVLVSLGRVPYWYDYEAGRLDAVEGCGVCYSPVNFIYEWPYQLR